MNMLSTVLSKKIIEMLEHMFINNSPAIQDMILSEVKNFLTEGAVWLDEKLKHPSTGDKK